MILRAIVERRAEANNGTMTEYYEGAHVNRRSLISRLNAAPTRFVSAIVEENVTYMHLERPMVGRPLSRYGDVHITKLEDGHSLVAIGPGNGAVSFTAGQYRFRFEAGEFTGI